MRRHGRAPGFIQLIQNLLHPTSETALWSVLGSLYGDRTNKGSGNWAINFDNNGQPASENIVANRYEEALVTAGLSYTRGGGTNSNFQISGIDPNFSITNIPAVDAATAAQRHAFWLPYSRAKATRMGLFWMTQPILIIIFTCTSLGICC